MDTQNHKPELYDIYLKLASVHQVMDLATEDLHGCLKNPQHYLNRIMTDNNVIMQQQCEIWECMKMLEEIDPECRLSVF